MHTGKAVRSSDWSQAKKASFEWTQHILIYLSVVLDAHNI